ncbi:unnamed protein product [Lampetra fluviatilis]
MATTTPGFFAGVAGVLLCATPAGPAAGDDAALHQAVPTGEASGEHAGAVLAAPPGWAAGAAAAMLWPCPLPCRRRSPLLLLRLRTSPRRRGGPRQPRRLRISPPCLRCGPRRPQRRRTSPRLQGGSWVLMRICILPGGWAAEAAMPPPLTTYMQMDNVFEPPSSARLKFSLRRREEGELPLAFRCSLLALAQTAYPDLQGRALDSMALERLLDLAREVGIVLSINNDRQITSLVVAENIQAHLSLHQQPQIAVFAGVVACAGVPAPEGGAAYLGVDTLASPGNAQSSQKGGGE